jgi:ribonuclease R
VARKPARPLPTREQLLAFIQENPNAVSRREIVRAFGVAPGDRRELTAMIRELTEEGAIARGGKRRFGGAALSALPEVAVIEFTGIDEDGEALARPVEWRAEVPPPVIRVVSDDRRAPATGDRALARLRRTSDGSYEARVIRRLPARPREVLGVYRRGKVEPTDRRIKAEYSIYDSDALGAQEGDLVLVEPFEGMNRARIRHRFGPADAPGAVSLIAIHENNIPHSFARAVIADAEAARPAPMDGREDLRDIPLVTIDDEDARDFDDAVWAEPDDDPKNPGGFHLMVAIADVAWYVRPGAALDREAQSRGNSVYFPDRVVPMLPEQLSNDLCSLRPHEDRPVLAVHMWIDAQGKKLRHRFLRGMMRSAARLTYRQTQMTEDREQMSDRPPSDICHLISALFGAYAALRRARQIRGTLDLDLPERRIVMDDKGRISRIFPRPRYDSHRLIEEFMILANVAAAEALEQRRTPVMYRVHDEPSPEKLEALRGFLAGLGYKIAKGQVMRASAFDRILARAAETPHARVVNEMVLRSQAQATYEPDNIGHFGLALRRYCHFTSPIRRYADLLVHRALITAFSLGEGGLSGAEDAARFAELARHVSMTERRAAKAERDTADRLVAAFLADRVGALFEGRIQGVTRFGLFVHLDETGADGLLPISSLGAERFRLDEARHTLAGERSRTRYALGDDITVRLVEANPLTGGLVFALGEAPAPAPRRPSPPPKSRGKRRAGRKIRKR